MGHKNFQKYFQTDSNNADVAEKCFFQKHLKNNYWNEQHRRRERLKTFKNRILLLFDEVNFRNALYNINAYINKVETKLVKNRECLKIVQ